MTRIDSTGDARFLLIRECNQDAPNRAETETTTFALGCSWRPEAQFADAGFEFVSLHHLGQGQGALIECMQRTVPPESS